MNLTPLQLQLMEYSDKTLQFGTVILSKEYMRFLRIEEDTKIQFKTATCFKYNNIVCGVIGFDEENIIGNPFGRGRVCMFFETQSIQYGKEGWGYTIDIDELQEHFIENPELYDKNCLEWDDETSRLVLGFLESLSINK